AQQRNGPRDRGGRTERDPLAGRSGRRPGPLEGRRVTATGIAILAIVIVLALAIGLVLRRRSGSIRPATAARPAPSPAGSSPTPSSPAGPSSDHEDPTELQLLRNAGLADDGPSVVHFSADWCGPCAAVRRVVTDVVTRLN